MPQARSWWARYDALFAHNKSRNEEINNGIQSCVTARNKLVEELNAAIPKVKALYESGAAKPIANLDLGKPADTGAAAAATAGSAPESACSAADLRKALAGGDEVFLNGLADKTVVVQGMLLGPPEAAGEIAVAKIMAGGGTLAIALPLGTEMAQLPVATKVVVTGMAVKTDKGWIFKASTWGKAKDLEAGQPATRCDWPEPVAGAAK